MSSYTNNIPQPGDNPSNSQDQILQNFQTLVSAYGTLGDHYDWTNTNSPETRRHAKVTMPGLPTANAPGNVIPAPGTADCAIFGQTRNSQTTPFVTRDGLAPTAPLTNIWPLLPIKAYASFQTINGGGIQNIVPDDSFNINSPIVQTGFGSNFQFTMTNACRTSTYGVLWFGDFLNVTFRVGYNIVNANVFNITVGVVLIALPAVRMTVIVVES
jgi:hypothetical protein